MAKLGNYAVIITAMVIFMELLGIPSGLSAMLESIGVTINTNTATIVTADLANSGLYSWIFGNAGILAVLIAGGAIIIGFFAKSYDVSIIIAPFIVSIASLYISTFWTLILFARTFNQAWLIGLVATIFIPLGVGFIMACVDYFKGEV